MRSRVVAEILNVMGYEGPEQEGMVLRNLMQRVFIVWLAYVEDINDKREAERKASLRRWDQQLWVLKKRAGHQHRLQKEQEAIQHVWPPRGIPSHPQRCPVTTPETISPQVLPSLPPRPATESQQLAWSHEAASNPKLQRGREWASERRQVLERLYLPSAAAGARNASSSSHGFEERCAMENTIYSRNILVGMLDERIF